MACGIHGSMASGFTHQTRKEVRTIALNPIKPSNPANTLTHARTLTHTPHPDAGTRAFHQVMANINLENCLPLLCVDFLDTAYCTGHVLAGTGTGIYESKDGAASWQLVKETASFGTVMSFREGTIGGKP